MPEIGPRTSRLARRNFYIFSGGIILGLTAAVSSVCLGYGKLTFWIALPFFLVAFVSWFGLFNIGPLKKGFSEAIDADKLEKERNRQKQPWEQ